MVDGMKPYLAIDTSSALGSVAVGRGDRLLAEAVVGVSARHSESLLPAIDFVLRAASVQPGDLGGVVVAGGPGSFTGLRVAGATAKGLVRALDLPLFAYSGLQALAAGIAGGGRPVCALFDARRGEVYAGCYGLLRGELTTHLAPVGAAIDEVLERTRGLDPVFAGDGALRYRLEIESAGAEVAPPHLSAVRAGALLWLADAMPEAGRIASPVDWEPEYLRAAGAQREAGR